MHHAESLDPVVSRLLANIPYLDCWVADMADSLHLLDTLRDYLHDPDPDVSADRLLALLRVALAGLSGGVDELSAILNLSEKAKASPKASPVSPVMSPVLTPSDTDTTPDMTPDTTPDMTPDTTPDMTPVTLDQFVAALFPVNGKN